MPINTRKSSVCPSHLLYSARWSSFLCRTQVLLFLVPTLASFIYECFNNFQISRRNVRPRCIFRIVECGQKRELWWVSRSKECAVDRKKGKTIYYSFNDAIIFRNIFYILYKKRLQAILLAGHNITFTNLGNGRYRAEHKAREIRALI